MEIIWDFMSSLPTKPGKQAISHARKAILLLSRTGLILSHDGDVEVFFAFDASCPHEHPEVRKVARPPLRQPLCEVLDALPAPGTLCAEHEVRDEEDEQLYRIRFTATPIPLPGSTEFVVTLSVASEPLQPQEVFLPREHWRTLMETSPGIISMVDQNGTILFMNRTLLHKQVEDIIGFTIEEILPEDTAVAVRDILNKVFRTAKPYNCLVPAVIGGQERWFETHAGPVLENGKVMAVVLNSLDVTERRRVEVALRESEEQFRLVFQRMRDAFVLFEVVHDAQDNTTGYRILEANPAAEQVTRVSREAAIGHLLAEVIPTTDPAVLEQFAVACKEDGYVHFEQYSEHFGRYFEVVAYRPQPGRLALMLADISDRRNAEDALRASENKYRLLMETLQEGVIAVDLNGYTTFANACMARMLGYRPDEMFGRHIDSFVDAARTGRLNVLLHGMLEGRHAQYDFELIGKGGETVYVTAETAPIVDVDGRVIGALAGMVDVSARKKAEMDRRMIEGKMQQVQRLESLGLLAGNIAMDFNDIMVSLLDNARHAMETLPPDSPAHAFVDNIQAEASKAANLSQQMMAYAGRVAQAKCAIDVNDFIRETEPLLKASLPDRCTLTLDLAEGMAVFLVDPSQLRQALVNLVTNAGEAVGDSAGEVRLATSMRACTRRDLQCRYLIEDWPEGDYAVIEVSDSGRGVPPEVLDRLFDPFFTTKSVGRGFGLAATLGFLRAHKGLVHVASTEGSGTTVCMMLPAQVQPVAPAAPRAGDAKGDEILIVDDEESVVAVVSRMLIRRGFRVLTAPSGTRALAVFREESARVRVAILDVIMPNMDGEATLKALRKIRPDLPVLLSSGLGERELAARFASYGNIAYIRKPYRAATLSERLNALLEANPK